jgi:hypothetical protein
VIASPRPYTLDPRVPWRSWLHREIAPSRDPASLDPRRAPSSSDRLTRSAIFSLPRKIKRECLGSLARARTSAWSLIAPCIGWELNAINQTLVLLYLVTSMGVSSATTCCRVCSSTCPCRILPWKVLLVFLCLGTSVFCRRAAMVTGVMETIHTEVSDCYQALKFPCPDTIANLIYPHRVLARRGRLWRQVISHKSYCVS